MNIKNILLILLLCYLLALYQTSFLVHFSILGYTINLVLILVIVLSLFERPFQKNGLLAGLFGGFFLDVFSSRFLGFWILILFTLAIFIHFIVKKYVRIPTIKK